MAIAFSNSGKNAASSGTLAVTVTVNAGDTVVVLILCNNVTGARTVTSVTDDGSNSYAQRTSVANTNSVQAFLWSTGPSAAAAATSVSVAMSDTYTELAVVVLTYTGASALGAVTTNTGTLTSPTITATVSAKSSWAVGGLGSAADVTYSQNTGTLRDQEDSGLLDAMCGVDNTGGQSSDVLTVDAGASNVFAAVALELEALTAFDLIPGTHDGKPRAKRTLIPYGMSGPGFTGPEAVHWELWRQDPQPQPNWAYNRKLFAIAMAASSGIAPIDAKQLTLKEAVHLEAWMYPPQYPVAHEGFDYWLTRVQAALEASGMVKIDPKILTLKEATSVDKWKSTYPDQTPRFARRNVDEQFVTDLKPPTAEVLRLDKWHPTYPDAVTRIRPNIHGQALLPVLSSGETVFADKWHPEYASMIEHPLCAATYIASGGILVPAFVPSAILQNYVDPGINNYLVRGIGTGIR